MTIDPPPAAPRWVDVQVTTVNSCALSNRGKVRCWGEEENPRIEEFPIPAGVRLESFSHEGRVLCGVQDSGRLWCNIAGLMEVIPDGADFVEVDVAPGQACARRSDDSVVCIREPGWPDVAPPPRSAYAMLALTVADGLGLGLDGRVDVWGFNATALAPPDSTFAFATLARGMACGAAVDTHIAECWPSLGPDGSTPTEPVSRLFSSRGWGVCAEIEADHRVECWSNFEGRADRWPPAIAAEVPAGTQFDAISLNEDHACGVTADGDLKCWGAAPAIRLEPPALDDGEW